MKKIYLIFVFICFFFMQIGITQTNNEKTIQIKGRIFIEEQKPLINLFVVNKRINKGKFIDPSGNFDLQIRKNDVLVFGSFGYKNVEITFKDSIIKDYYYIEIRLSHLQYNLGEITIFGKKELQDIYKEIEELGIDQKTYSPYGKVNTFGSPITALYETFSKKRQKEREALELMNASKRRKILKQLFSKYVDYKIIELKDEKFDEFIDFCKITDDQVKYMRQLEFIMLIKNKYYQFSKFNSKDYYRKNPHSRY